MVAFHFRGDPGIYTSVWVQTLKEDFFQYISEEPGSYVHVEVFTGDFLAPKHAKAKDTILNGLLGYNPRKWRTVDVEEFAAAIFSVRIWVLAAEGLTEKLQDHLDARFGRRADYLGAIEIDPANQVHWALYKQSLVPRYRFVNGEIRIFYRKFEEAEGADAKDTAAAGAFEKRGFQVVFEDTGPRHTIFDRYQSFEHSKRIAALERYLSEHLSRITDEILMRLSAADPRLNDTLYSALATFDRVNTPEDVAQIALSCRRFQEGLADLLYPPRATSAKGRKLGQGEYRNRLWAYVEAKLAGREQELALAHLDDVGRRIDAIDRLSHKGVHNRASISRLDVHRLIVTLLILAYDLLSLSPPALEVPVEPYDAEITKLVRDFFEDQRRKDSE